MYIIKKNYCPLCQIYGSVGLSAGIQSAGDLVSETLSPFDSKKIVCQCQSIEIYNNKQ